MRAADMGKNSTHRCSAFSKAGHQQQNGLKPCVSAVIQQLLELPAAGGCRQPHCLACIQVWRTPPTILPAGGISRRPAPQG